MEKKYIRKSHNVSLLMYHIVCPAKYRKAIFTDDLDIYLKDVCIEISHRYEIVFLEIGTDKDHVHFLVQSVPMYSPKKIVQMIKSITAKKIFAKFPRLKKEVLWGGELWTDGYFVSTVGAHGDADMIAHYVKNQGNEEKNRYKKLHSQKPVNYNQLSLI